MPVKKLLSEAEKEALIDTLVSGTLSAQAAKGPDLRQLHPKSHGLLWGEFVVEPNIPEAMRVGIFANQAKYPAWVRLSNGKGVEQINSLKADQDPDVRGLAIKLMDVPGTKVLDDEQSTQDFVMVSHPVFFVADLKQYIDFMQAAFGKPTPELVASLARNFQITKEMTSKPLAPLLSLEYWSTTPYKLGNLAIKFLVKPSQKVEGGAKFKANSENCLREDLVEYVTEQKQAASFDFMVQVFVDEEHTPTEDATTEWTEADAPPIKLAALHIPSQKFDFEKRRNLDRGLAFNPWHTLPEHEPLGEVNLARKRVYLESTKHRRQHLPGSFVEPLPYERLKDDLAD